MAMTRLILAAMLAGAVAVGSAPALAAESYDIVVSGGRVMDPESGLDAPRNLGIRGGKIVAIADAPLVGRRVIDATGRVVAPGFIDMHSHASNTLLGGRVQAFDGVTTAFELEAGQQPVALAYANAAKEGRAINYGYSSSWGSARMIVLSHVELDGTWEGMERALSRPEWSGTKPTAEQQRDIFALVEQGLDEGALGIGAPIGYVPAASHEEIYELAKIAARRDATIFTHMRSTMPDFASTQEVIADAASTGAHWYIMHVYWKSPQQMDMLEAAMRAGVRITPETKGLQTGSTFLNAEFFAPEVMQRVGRSPGDIIYFGRHIASFEELARLRKENPRALVVTMEETDETNLTKRAETARRLKTPGWVLGSDAMPWTDYQGRLLPHATWPLPANAWAHPRSAANFLRVIQKYVNEWRLVSLMDVLRAGALNPALALQRSVPQMQAKGRIKLDADADIIIFDPARVQAVNTLEQPARLANGMDYVLVNGSVLIDKGKLDTRKLPGIAVRRTSSIASN